VFETLQSPILATFVNNHSAWAGSEASQVQSSMHTYVHGSALCNLLGGSHLQQNRQFARYHRCSRRPAGKSSSAVAANLQLKDVPIVMPEEYWLPPGELSTINRNSQVQNQDIFRCFGCTRSECEVRAQASWTAWVSSAGKTTAKPLQNHGQTKSVLQGTAGCQETSWTREAGGYLRQILNARVYDVAVSLYLLSSLHRAFKLSAYLLLEQ